MAAVVDLDEAKGTSNTYMKLAILSDTRLPTNPAFSGHGLGQIVHAVATGLAERGHGVTLFAAPGSVFAAGKLVTATDERDFLQHDLSQYECVIDNTHQKITNAVPKLPIIQVSHDREAFPGVNAVFPSAAHRGFYNLPESRARIVHNGVKAQDTSAFGERRGGYVAYMSTFYREKQPLAAVQAAHVAGVKLMMAGPTPCAPPPGGVYVGPLSGRDKFEFLYHADALLFPASTECAPVTVLEAQSVGTPVIVSGYGGSSENMQNNVTGYVCGDVNDFAGAIQHIGKIDREACRQWIADNRSEAQMVDKYEKLLQSVANGERW